MAYSQNTWGTGDTITAAKLNNIETGVANAALADDVAPLIYNNSGAHNAIYRGKYLGTSVTSAQHTAISSGTFEDLYIGDYWTISSVNWRIADFDYYYNSGDTNCATHHAVLVPDTSLYSAPMNATNTTEGGYVGSAMYTGEDCTPSSTTYTGLTNAKTTISNAFGDYLLSHRIYLTNAVTNGYPSAGAWCDSTVDLMTEEMVYGSGIQRAHTAYNGTSVTIPTQYRVDKSQLALFRLNPRMANIRVTYWLRDVVSASYFANVSFNGNAYYGYAFAVGGVRPAFCIS